MGKWPKNSEELKYFVLNSFGFHFLCAHKRECENVQDSSVIKCTSIASILVKVWQSNLPFQQTICTVELASDVSQRWSLGLGCNFSFRKDFVSLDFFHCKKKLWHSPFCTAELSPEYLRRFPFELGKFLWLSPSAVKFDIVNVLLAKAKEPVWHHLFALKLRLPDLSWCSGIQAFVSFSQTCWFQPYSCYLAIITRAPKGSRWERKRWELVQWKIFLAETWLRKRSFESCPYFWRRKKRKHICMNGYPWHLTPFWWINLF